MIKKKSRSNSLKPPGRIGKKIRKKKRESSTSFKRRERSQDEEHMESGGVNEPSAKEMSDKELNGEQAEEVKKPVSNDVVFNLSWKRCREIIDIVRSRKTPTQEILTTWDEYSQSFYRQMCTYFRVDYRDLEKTLKDDDDEDGKKQLKKRKPSLREQLKNPPPPDHPEYDKLVQRIKDRKRVCHMEALMGPYDFGVYLYGKPKSIPRPLYRLVKEAVDIMNNSTDVDEKELTVVEEKIRFFCNYFHAHLPTGWKYDRVKASSTLVDDYDPTVKPRDAMAGYYPIRTKLTNDYDKDSHLSPIEIDDVKSVIYSRKLPLIQAMDPLVLTFYCKLCSCFGIDYLRLHEATKDDVCLMKTGKKPPSDFFIA